MVGARKSTLVGMLAVVGLPLALVSCEGKAPPTKAPPAAPREVVYSLDPAAAPPGMFHFLDSIHASPSVEEIEAHGYGDAQRLSTSTDGVYGPKAEIYPIANLDQPTDYYDGQTFVPVAIIRVGPYPIDPASNPMHLTSAKDNCLYLRHITTGTDRWEGYVNVAKTAVPPGQPPQYCDPAANAGNSVNVGSHQMAGAAANDYAPVTRFTEDNAGQTLAGLRCGNEWCEFGTDRVTLPATAGGQVGATIKGWHDEQRLAVYDATQHKLTRSHIRAIMYPDKDYKGWKPGDYQWRVVAHVNVKDPQNELDKTKYGHLTGQPHWGLRTGTNDLLLKLNADQTFDGRFVDAKGDTTDVVITRGKSQGEYPGVARWRWTDSDESGWIGCLDGCCLVDDGPVVMKSAIVATAAPAKRR
jgi:hypothetical protein